METIGENLDNPKKTGFDDRIVEYEKIHQIKDEYFEKLVDAVDPKVGEVILDGMDGYGSVSKWILARAAEKGVKVEIFTLDESGVQIDRARQNIPDIDSEHIIQADMRETGFPNEKFDTVVIKMGIHEVPKEEQPKLFAEVYRILKPGGKFVIWELALDSDNQEVFQDFIRKKDELAGFTSMVENRYLPRHDELKNLFTQTGFVGIQDFFEMIYKPSTLGRKEELVSKERKELLTTQGSLSVADEERLVSLGEARVKEWNQYIRDRVPPELYEKMDYQDLGDDIRIQVKKVIMVGRKTIDGQDN